MKTFRLAGPTTLSNVYTTNVYNESDSKLYTTIRHIHVTNRTNSDAHFRLFLGANGANAVGTELYYNQLVKANDVFDAYLGLRLDSTDFLVGGSDTANALTMTIEGDKEVA